MLAVKVQETQELNRSMMQKGLLMNAQLCNERNSALFLLQRSLGVRNRQLWRTVMHEI